MFDRPYRLPESTNPETTATMTVVCHEIRQSYPHIPMGVQILTACNKEALATALAAGNVLRT